MYVPDKNLPAASDAAKAIKKLNETNHGLQCHVSLDSFRCFKVFFKNSERLEVCHIINCFGLSLQMRAVSCEGIKLWPLMREDWIDSIVGTSAISSTSFRKLFDRAMAEYFQTRQSGLFM